MFRLAIRLKKHTHIHMQTHTHTCKHTHTQMHAHKCMHAPSSRCTGCSAVAVCTGTGCTGCRPVAVWPSPPWHACICAALAATVTLSGEPCLAGWAPPVQISPELYKSAARGLAGGKSARLAGQPCLAVDSSQSLAAWLAVFQASCLGRRRFTAGWVAGLTTICLYLLVCLLLRVCLYEQAREWGSEHPTVIIIIYSVL